MLKITAKAGSGGDKRCNAPFALTTHCVAESNAITVSKGRCLGGFSGSKANLWSSLI